MPAESRGSPSGRSSGCGSIPTQSGAPTTSSRSRSRSSGGLIRRARARALGRAAGRRAGWRPRRRSRRPGAAAAAFPEAIALERPDEVQLELLLRERPPSAMPNATASTDSMPRSIRKAMCDSRGPMRRALATRRPVTASTGSSVAGAVGREAVELVGESPVEMAGRQDEVDDEGGRARGRRWWPPGRTGVQARRTLRRTPARLRAPG